MLLTIFVSVIITLWIIFCVGLFTYHYLLEVVLDLPVTGQSPCTAHAALKQLIERLLQETLNLPNLQRVQDPRAFPSDENNRTYEDLLATAIINKVISTSQNNLPTSSAASASSRISISSRKRDEKEYFFGEETLDSKWKTTDLDTSSVSSLEEWIHSDSSVGSKKYVDRVTLTIKQDIEEVSQTDSENENDEDDSEYFRNSSSLLNDDEPNWFLQKRQFQGTHSPVPVPMLVPNPTTEAKVLIGDQEVDDTSDLSDVASDYGDTEIVPGRQSLLIESRTVIGGKNPLHNGGSESESSGDSGVKEVNCRDQFVYDEPDFVPKTDITVDDDNVEDASILSVYSNTEKEAEYTERYASLPRTILKTPTPPSRPSLSPAKFSEITQTDNAHIQNGEDIDEEKEYDREFTGRVSKREKEKWKHAVEMKNNPYSKENIEKRIQRSNNAVSSLFGPDYYARQASSPSGGKLKSSEGKELTWPRVQADEEQEENKEITYKAVPAIVSQNDEIFYVREDDAEKLTPEVKPHIVSVVDGPMSSISEITSDSDLSYINCYDVEKSQVYKTTKEGTPFVNQKTEPNIEMLHLDKSDENGNLASEQDKHHSIVSEDDLEIITKEVPTPKERIIISRSRIDDKPNYVKSTSVAKQRSIPQPYNIRVLRRHKSETDLLDDSFDKPPTVLSKKKDNTLISKIYLDPHVRSFALSNRGDQLPIENTDIKPGLKNQLSVDATVFAHATGDKRYYLKNKSYSSDDGSALKQNGKQTIYSSEEDLIDFDNNTANSGNMNVSKIYQNASVRNYRVKSDRPSMSSEDGMISDHSTKSDQQKSTKDLIYSSTEDLLSADTEKVAQKKDNTLISKIYQDPHVRSYALTRNNIPVLEESLGLYKKSHTLNEGYVGTTHQSKEKSQTILEAKVESNGNLSTADVSLESFMTEESFRTVRKPIEEDKFEPEQKISSPDPDIDELAKKKIVHNILGQFSKSQPNLAAVRFKKPTEERKLSGDADEITVSVKDLKKKFENNDAKSKVVSSLTARSLSKHMRESLRN